jgi:hypothetical protein
VSAVLADPLTDLAGAPFLDDGFAAKRLLAAVAAVRHVHGRADGLAEGISTANIDAWLAPARALMLHPHSPSLPARPLNSQRRAQVAQARQEMSTRVSAWSQLLELPVRYALLQPADGAISASSRAWPQHVLLAPEAFATAPELAEQVLHELAHQWLYLIQEVWALTADDAGLFTLPSGTAGRQAWEVLGAAHVAAVLALWYRQPPAARPDRVEQLRSYGAGCLNLLEGSNAMTDAGRLIAHRVKEAL